MRHSVSYKCVREKAQSLAIKLKINGCKACDNWIYKFCARNGFSSRKPTNVGQEDNKSPEDKKETAETHLQNIEYFTTGISSDCTVNMDETPVYVDMHSSQTLSFKGEKNTVVNGTGHSKTRFTVVLAITASGHLLKTLIILKNLKKNS